MPTVTEVHLLPESMISGARMVTFEDISRHLNRPQFHPPTFSKKALVDTHEIKQTVRGDRPMRNLGYMAKAQAPAQDMIVIVIWTATDHTEVRIPMMKTTIGTARVVQAVDMITLNLTVDRCTVEGD